MWNLLKREDQECRRLRDAIEAAAMKSADAVSVESKSLTELLAAHHRKHLETCADCRNAVQDLVAMKELFRGAVRFRQEERPWFAARVMAAIASRESKLAERVSAWTEFPRFASRLTWITAVDTSLGLSDATFGYLLDGQLTVDGDLLTNSGDIVKIINGGIKINGGSLSVVGKSAKKRTMSAAGRRKIAAAQRARWAKWKAKHIKMAA